VARIDAVRPRRLPETRQPEPRQPEPREAEELDVSHFPAFLLRPVRLKA
jgi:hypothetical protein